MFKTKVGFKCAAGFLAGAALFAGAKAQANVYFGQSYDLQSLADAGGSFSFQGLTFSGFSVDGTNNFSTTTQGSNPVGTVAIVPFAIGSDVGIGIDAALSSPTPPVGTNPVTDPNAFESDLTLSYTVASNTMYAINSANLVLNGMGVGSSYSGVVATYDNTLLRSSANQPNQPNLTQSTYLLNPLKHSLAVTDHLYAANGGTGFASMSQVQNGFTTGSAGAVPEPATLGILSAGGLLLLKRRRRNKVGSL